ncbi:hypothetical protein ACUY3M_00665 [Corynebacterium suicordis]
MSRRRRNLENFLAEYGDELDEGEKKLLQNALDDPLADSLEQSDIGKLRELVRDKKSRNQIIRKSPLVEYRCNRGCLLVAVFFHMNEKYLIQGRIWDIEEVERERFTHVFTESEVPNDEMWMATSLSEYLQVSEVHIRGPRGDEVDKWTGYSGESFEDVIMGHCSHEDFSTTREQVSQDIEALRKMRKKTVYPARRE